VVGPRFVDRIPMFHASSHPDNRITPDPQNAQIHNIPPESLGGGYFEAEVHYTSIIFNIYIITWFQPAKKKHKEVLILLVFPLCH